jgi:signal transduction histidine kinase/prepilin signal peptidase PulO-like enzyme (type II secretory pathway)
MNLPPGDLPRKHLFKGMIRTRHFWIVAVMLVASAFLHYFTPQVRLPPLTSFPLLTRHAIERIIFILPVAGAAFAFGQAGGLVTLALAVLIMLPRAFLISSSPADALLETVAVAVVGYLVIWMIETQEREKSLRQKAVSQLQTINAVTAIVTGSLELEQILNGALDKVLEVTKVTAGSIYLLDRETQELTLAVYRGVSPEFAREVAKFKLGESLTGWVGQSGEPIVVDDLLQEPRLTTSLTSKAGMRSLIAVPLKSRDKVLGVMNLTDSQHHLFTSQDVQLLTAIGSQIGVAIENAQLHQDVARQLRIEHRLNEVAEKLSSELELDRILPKVLQIAEELIGADGGVIALLDRESNLIGYPYLHNLPRKLEDVTVPKGKGLAGEVMTTGRSVVIADYPAYTGALPDFVEVGVTSIVAVPIVSGDQPFGALSLVSLNKAKSFSDRDITILAGIGHQAGIAIENARLYENMRFYVRQITRAQEDERKRIARELHDDTAQALIDLSRRLDNLAISREQLSETVIWRLEEFQELIDSILQGVRRFSRDLRPSVLDDLGLLPALEWLTANLTDEDGIETELKVYGDRRRLPPEAELALFRIVQEALSNVRRHSQASRVVTVVEFGEGRVRITVKDNGQGGELPGATSDLASTGKLGLIGMHERARLLDGTLTVRSEPGKGTTVTVDAPV